MYSQDFIGEVINLNELTNIIELSIKNTLKQIEVIEPKVVHNIYFGAYEISPCNLVICYFFKTNEEWNNAKNNKFTVEISKLTISNMIQNGYPSSAFDVNIIPLKKHKFASATKEQEKEYIKSMTHRKVEICFASKEDVDKKANGNYYYYFK